MGALAHARHCQRARRVVPQIVEREPRDPETLRVPREGARQRSRIAVARQHGLRWRGRGRARYRARERRSGLAL
jgi:hypothetical protein